MSEALKPEVVILGAALDLPAGERAAYLDGACAGDAGLRRQVEDLLEAHSQAESFMEATSAQIYLKKAELVHPALTEKPGDTIGRYRLLEQIGEGGFGVVYMAEQREPVRRKVALKIIKAGMDTREVVARFEAERQALALMDHPNIAKVLDGGATATGRLYFVMELVRGIRITDFCDQNRLVLRERIDLFSTVCHAVQHAHQKGIIHRDIKPSNILITINDGAAVPKVIDFGIAKATQQELTEKTLFTAYGQFMGTPAYMSPEQAVMTSLDIDTRSDIYSLGVLLYELLTGRLPFDTEALMKVGLDEVRRTLREVEPPKPSTRLSTLAGEALAGVARFRKTDAPKLVHSMRGDLDWIVMKCLEKDRARRYETANGLAFDIQRHLNSEPVNARPPSRLYRFEKSVQRNKLAFSAAVSIAVAILIGLGMSVWQWRRAERTNEQLAIALMEMHLERMQREGPLRSSPLKLALQGPGIYGAWPSKGGGRELRFSSDEGARVYDTARGTPTTRPLDVTPPIRLAGFSPDESKLFALGRDADARLWDANTGRRLTDPLVHEGPVIFAEFSPDGRRLLTVSQQRPALGAAHGLTVAMIWDVNSGVALTSPLKNDETSLLYARFTDDGKHFVTISEKGAFAVWDGQTGKRNSIHVASPKLAVGTPQGRAATSD